MMYNLVSKTTRKYYLSTEGYYFFYRPDRYNPSATRAALVKIKTGQEVDSVTVSGSGWGVPDLSHHDVINHFEAQITLKKYE